jgi:hypothetical protein
MRIQKGQVAEIQLHLGEASTLIACPSDLVPATGQYVLAVQKGATQATPLFFADSWNQGFLAAPPSPESWRPGTGILLYGPLGKEFRIPADAQRLALIAFGDTNARLLPLASATKSDRYKVTLFSDAPLAKLPPDLEAYPLRELGEVLSWADFFAIDLALEDLESLTEHFENIFQEQSSIRGQVLIHTRMPCGGLADCGVCAVKVKKSWKFTCKDGPVFDLRDLLKGARG